MTVRRNKDNRNGATLIVTEEELEYLWHKINASDARTFRQYCEDEHYKPLLNIFTIFSDLDNKYRPEGQ